jgi:hypothetical protein
MASVSSGPVSVHQTYLRGVASRWGVWWMMFGLLAALGLFLLILGIAKPESGTLLPGLLIFVLSLGALVPPILGLIKRVRRVEVHPDRIAWWAPEGEEQAPWSTVVSVNRFEKITNNFWYEAALTLTLADGRKVVFDQSLSGFTDLADNAQEITAQLLLPKKEAEARAGGAEFGPVTLKADGVSHKGKFSRWSEIDFAVFNGYLIFVPSGGKFTYQERREVALAEIPNWPVLVELMVRVGKPPIEGHQTYPSAPA